MKNISTMNYDPKKCPCFNCTDRTPYCHGHCAKERAFNESKPKKPTNTYCASGKMRDVFHKKGRVIRHGTK